MNVLFLFDSNYTSEYVKINAFDVFLFMGLDAYMFGV